MFVRLMTGVGVGILLISACAAPERRYGADRAPLPFAGPSLRIPTPRCDGQGAPPPAAATELEPIDALIRKLRAVAGASGPEGRAVAEEIQRHGAAAIPYVLPLLGDPELRIRELAEYVLRDLEGLEERHLDALIRADSSREDTWLPPAIARIGTPRAIAYLVERLWERAEIENQLGFALTRSAPRSAPEIVRRLRVEPPKDGRLPAVICRLFSQAPDESAVAIPGLLALAGDADLPVARREQAVRLIGCLGPAAAPHQPEIRQLGEGTPALAPAARSTLVKVGALDALASALATAPTVTTLLQVASLGAGARGAGASVVPLVGAADWDVRLAAIKTVGYIDYGEGVPALIRALGIAEDWRAVFAAAEALGRLKAASAAAPLEQVAAKHWYPPVRFAAEKALRVIRGTDQYCRRWHPQNFNIEFHDVGSRADVPRPGALPSLRQGPDELGGLQLWFHRDTQAQVGLAAFGGVLLGADAGEWGGALTFAAGSKRDRLLEKNTTGIHRVGSSIVAATGLAHLMMDDGVLYRVERPDRNVPPVAVRWRQLPGAPYQSGFLEDGRLFIRTQAGDVALSPEGELSMFPE